MSLGIEGEERLCYFCLQDKGPGDCVHCIEHKAAGEVMRITFRVQCKVTGRWGTCNNEHPKVGGMRPVLWDRHKAWVLVDPRSIKLSTTSTALPGMTPGGAYFKKVCTQPYPHARHDLDA